MPVLVPDCFSPDGNSEGEGSAGFLIGIKRGSEMNNANGSGLYRTVAFELGLDHRLRAGTPDVERDTNACSVRLATSFGSFDLDGVGTLSVHRGFTKDRSLDEVSSVMRHESPPDDVFDAEVTIASGVSPDAEGTEMLTYEVAPNGVVTLDAADEGGTEGYLSPDGNVFVLPVVDIDGEGSSAGVLVGLRVQ